MRTGEVAAAALFTLVGTAAAFAAPTWTSPFTLPFSPLSRPAFGFAEGGVQFIGRVDTVEPVDLNNVVTRLIVSRTSPGADPVDDLVIDSTPTAVPLALSLAVAPNGGAVLVYAESTSNDVDPSPPPLRWRAVYRASSGVWESPVTLFTDSSFDPDFVFLCAIAPDGSAVAGATHIEPDDAVEPAPGQTDTRLDLALHPAGGTWQPSQRLSPVNESADGVSLAADDGGNFMAAWAARTDEGGTDATGDDRETLVVRRLLAGQTVWNTTEPVSAENVFVSQVAVGPSGNAVAAFQFGGQVWAATRVDSVHTFSAPAQLVTTAADSSPRAVGAAPDGTAYVLYSFNGITSGQSNVGIVKRPPGGDWTDPAPVSPLGFLGDSGAIAFLNDDAIAVWQANDADDVNNGTHLVEASRWPAGASTAEGFRDFEELPGAQDIHQVVPDRAGGILATWNHGSEIHGAAYDAGRPALVASTIPTSSSAGSTAIFAATFADLWSAVTGGPTWDFGDGTSTVSGATVDHAYAAPGSYNGSVRAADAIGNETVVPFTVAVGPEAIGPVVTVILPACPDSLSTQACERRRRRRKLWQTLRGTASDAPPSSGITAVEVGMTIVAGKKTLVLNGARFVRNGDPSLLTPATFDGTSWSLRLPKLRAGRATIIARVRDAAGNASEAAVEVRLR